MSRGVTRPWSKAEEDFLIASCHMTNQDIAAHLGRTLASVQGRKRVLRQIGVEFPHFAVNKSPTKVGARPLLAQTCPECGLLLQAMWFEGRDVGRRGVCKRCRESQKRQSSKTRRNPTKHEAAKYKDKYQSLTIAGATRNRQPWTEEDMTILRNPDLTIFQKALMLHRTYQATNSACFVNKCQSKVGLGDPERDQWFIDNPNYDHIQGKANA